MLASSLMVTCGHFVIMVKLTVIFTAFTAFSYQLQSLQLIIVESCKYSAMNQWLASSYCTHNYEVIHDCHRSEYGNHQANHQKLIYILYAQQHDCYFRYSQSAIFTFQCNSCSVPRWLRAGMAIGRRAQNARNIRAKRVNYRTLINAIARSQYLTVWHMHAPCEKEMTCPLHALQSHNDADLCCSSI